MTRSSMLMMLLTVLAWILTAITTAETSVAQSETQGPSKTQGSSAKTESEAEPAADQLVSERTLFDFRRMLMLAFSVVFVLIVGYLVLSHRKNAALAEDVAFLRKRIDSLESR